MKKIALKKPPAEKVREMRKAELSDDDITKALKPDFSNQEVDDAFNQAAQMQDDNILDQLEQFEPAKQDKQENKTQEDLLEEAPSPDVSEESFASYNQHSYAQQMPEMSSSQIQELVESVVEEKWEDLMSKVGDVNLWKESVNNDLEAVKQEILRTQERFNNLQNILIGKVQDYNKSVTELNAEMKALEQVMQKIIEPLTSNVKELSKITGELKKKK